MIGAGLASIEASGMPTPEEFDENLLEAIHYILRQVLGAKAHDTILLYLDRKKGLKRESIASNIEAFDSVMHELLGSSAQKVENLIIKHLCIDLGLEHDANPNPNFAEYVQKLRNRVTVE